MLQVYQVTSRSSGATLDTLWGVLATYAAHHFSFCFYLAGNLCVLNSPWEDCKVHRVPISAACLLKWGEPQNKQKKLCKVQNACNLCHFGNCAILLCIPALIFVFSCPKQIDGCGENHFEFRVSAISAKAFRHLLPRDGLTFFSFTVYTCFLLGIVCLCMVLGEPRVLDISSKWSTSELHS